MCDGLRIEEGRNYEVTADGVALLTVEHPVPGYTRGNAKELKRGDVITCVKAVGVYPAAMYLFKHEDAVGQINVAGGQPLELAVKVVGG
jgi:hypothetical protein